MKKNLIDVIDANIPKQNINDEKFLQIHKVYLIVGILILLIVIVVCYLNKTHWISIITFLYTLSLVYLSYNNIRTMM